MRVVRWATQEITVLFNMKPTLLARIAAYVLHRTKESFRRRLGTLLRRTAMVTTARGLHH